MAEEGRPRVTASRVEWARRHALQLTALLIVLVILIACCNLPAWPTVIWYAASPSCGTVTNLVSKTQPGGTRAETCFAQAYRRCSPATIGADFRNLDYSATYSFVIEPYGFACAIGVLWNGGSTRPFGGSAGVGYCSSARQEADGLQVLGCQSLGDITLPGDWSSQPQAIGGVGGYNPS
jgi:hypothetical protein